MLEPRYIKQAIILPLLKEKRDKAYHDMLCADGDLAAQEARYQVLEKYNMKWGQQTPEEDLRNCVYILKECQGKYAEWVEVVRYAEEKL